MVRRRAVAARDGRRPRRCVRRHLSRFYAAHAGQRSDHAGGAGCARASRRSRRDRASSGMAHDSSARRFRPHPSNAPLYRCLALRDVTFISAINCCYVAQATDPPLSDRGAALEQARPLFLLRLGGVDLIFRDRVCRGVRSDTWIAEQLTGILLAQRDSLGIAIGCTAPCNQSGRRCAPSCGVNCFHPAAKH